MIERFGNTVSSSIPIGIKTISNMGTMEELKILISGFGVAYLGLARYCWEKEGMGVSDRIFGELQKIINEIKPQAKLVRETNLLKNLEMDSLDLSELEAPHVPTTR